MSNARRLAVSGAALTALLVLVAIASRAHRPGGGSGAAPAHPPELLVHYLVIAMMVLFPFGVLLVVWALAYRRKEAALEGKTDWRRTLLTVAILLGFLGFFRFVVIDQLHFHGFHLGGEPTSHFHRPAGSVGTPSKAPSTKSSPDWLTAYIVGSVVLALLVVVAAAVLTRRRSGEAWDSEAELAAAVDEVLKDTLDDLRNERDPRRAVIKTYARMEQVFAAYGAPRHRAETPHEYLARVLDRLQVSAFAAERITKLFARAKFSTHEIDSGMKDDAIDALAGMRAELAHEPEAA